MKYRTKYRVKLGLVGIGVIALAQVLIPNPLGVLAVITGTVPPWILTFGAVFWITWFSAIVFGLRVIKEAMKGVKYESKYCDACGKDTQQSQTKMVLREGFKYKAPGLFGGGGTSREEYERNVVGHEYRCDICGTKNTVAFSEKEQQTRAEAIRDRYQIYECPKCGNRFREYEVTYLDDGAYCAKCSTRLMKR